MDAVTPGTLVAERYRLIREIGLGGMGSVWLAYDQALASRCAIKLLHPEPGRQEELVLRLECEAKCAAQLRSPHVVDVLNRGQWQGKPYIVMEYMEGEDLAERLERVGRLDATTTYRIVAQVARALTRAHGLGIIHRDVKPANIFLVPGEDHEVAKVLDFGIAKHGALPNAFENPQEASFIGTPCYMSPEQASGNALDYRCDLWALAMITFECLTGSLPFPDESVANVIRTILGGELPALTANRPELPEALEAWWQRATARDAAHRFQSAKEFADALGDALEAFPKMPISRPERAAADAPTLLAPRELAPVSRRAPAPAPRGVSRAKPGAQHGSLVTLHAHAAPARYESLRVPMRRRRGLAIVGAAVCAALGFGASSLNAKLDSGELHRVLHAASGISEAAPVTQLALLEKPVPLSPPPAQAETAQEFAAQAIVTPAIHVSAQSPTTIAQRAPRTPVVAGADEISRTGLSVARSVEPVLPVEVTVEPVPSAPPQPSPIVPELRQGPAASDQLPERSMPPGVKDYGI